MDDAIILKFPCILRDKIQKGDFNFPDGTEFEYEQFRAYRVYFRGEGEKTSINREDFRSHAELGITFRGRDISKDPKYYGTSLFCSRDELENVKALQKPEKRIANGIVFQEGGPFMPKEGSSHVTWWLFEEVDLLSFEEVGENYE